MQLMQQNKINLETVQRWKQLVESWSPDERVTKEKRFVCRIDFHLLPILLIMYNMDYIVWFRITYDELPTVLTYLFHQDRNALPQARVQGLEDDIGLVGMEYNIVLSLKFIGYILMQGTRLGIFFCGAMLSGAFGGLFSAGTAAGFAHNKIASWRWLFIIEGAATVFFALVSGLVIPDWSSTTKWLSDEERALGMVRLYEDSGDEADEIKTMTAFKMAAKDHRVWLCILGQVRRLNRAVAIIGIILTMATLNIGARYFALFHILGGTYGCFQISNAWMANIAATEEACGRIGHE
ncbi:unnamed protein product [Penicillium pancosmium]